jgi:hypothetical protein
VLFEVSPVVAPFATQDGNWSEGVRGVDALYVIVPAPDVNAAYFRSPGPTRSSVKATIGATNVVPTGWPPAVVSALNAIDWAGWPSAFMEIGQIRDLMFKRFGYRNRPAGSLSVEEIAAKRNDLRKIPHRKR